MYWHPLDLIFVIVFRKIRCPGALMAQKQTAEKEGDKER
jgi:hypothetical protein